MCVCVCEVRFPLDLDLCDPSLMFSGRAALVSALVLLLELWLEPTLSGQYESVGSADCCRGVNVLHLCVDQCPHHSSQVTQSHVVG